jgi:hypothetical protein
MILTEDQINDMQREAFADDPRTWIGVPIVYLFAFQDEDKPETYGGVDGRIVKFEGGVREPISLTIDFAVETSMPGFYVVMKDLKVIKSPIQLMPTRTSFIQAENFEKILTTVYPKDQ